MANFGDLGNAGFVSDAELWFLIQLFMTPHIQLESLSPIRAVP